MKSLQCDFIECSEPSLYFVRLEDAIRPLSLPIKLNGAEVKVCRDHSTKIKDEYMKAKEKSIVRTEFYKVKKVLERIPFVVIKDDKIVLECQRCNMQWIPDNFEHLPQLCSKCRNKYWQTKRTVFHAGNFGGAANPK
jgi:hypothetical protein